MTKKVNTGHSVQKADTVFDAKLWRLGSSLTKGRMVNNIIASKRLIGASSDSIIKLMGEPSYQDKYFINYNVIYGDTNLLGGGFYILYISVDTTSDEVLECWLTD